MKKILILGTGNAQADLIRYCQNRNFKVYACARDVGGPGEKFTDDFRAIDIKNVKEVYKYAMEKNVDFIYSAGSEASIITTSAVCKKMNLPCFLNPEVANLFLKKNIYKDILGQNYSGNIQYMYLNEIQKIKKWNKYPSVVKPTDGSGQRGVYTVYDERDFYIKYNQSLDFSASKELIIEELIEGEEVSVNAYVVNGTIRFSIISDRLSHEKYPGGIIKEHVLPSKFENNKLVKKEISNLIEYVIKTLKIENGPVYFQIMVSKDRIKLIEVVPRLDGCHMWRIIKMYTGIDLIQITVDHLLGYELSFQQKVSTNNGFRIVFLNALPNTVFLKSKYIIDNSLFTEYYYEDGEIVKPVTKHIEKVGYSIFSTNVKE